MTIDSNEEMFERGARDANQDELNSFYYQHYYHYRRGYDQARRRIRRTPAGPAERSQFNMVPIIGGGLLVLLAFGILAYGLWGRDEADPAPSAGSSTVATSAVQASVPTRIPRIPTNTPEPPTPLPPVLRVDGAAVITNLSGGPLRLRAGAGTSQKVVARLPEGTEVQLLEGPVEADGYVWWRIQAGESSGWVAERSQEGVVWLQPK